MHSFDPSWRLATVWPAAVGVLAGVGLLVTFQQVVAQSVAHAEQARTDSAARELGLWHCKRQHKHKHSERELCLSHFSTPLEK
jgi:hypothetical protein